MRIAALQPSVSVMLAMLDRLDWICACTKWCTQQIPELKNANPLITQDSWSATADDLLRIRPDLVIASVPYRLEPLVQLLKTGIPVLTLSPRSLEDVYADLRLLGSIVGAGQRAESIIGTMQKRIEKIRTASLAVDERPLVYCEEWGKPLIHSQLWVQELVEAAGGRFLGPPGSVTTAEDVLEANPDVLVFAWCGAGDRVPLERIVEKRRWNQLQAVREGRVFCIPDELLNTPAPTLIDGLNHLAAAIHPGLFGKNRTMRAIRKA